MAPATSLPRGSSPKPPQNGQDQAHAADRHGLKKRCRSPTPSASVKCGLYQQHRPRTAIEQALQRSEEHTSELQSLMRISYAVFCLKKKNTKPSNKTPPNNNTKHTA